MQEFRSNRHMLKLIAAAATGFAVGYYFDPRAGRSRRTRLRDRMKKTARGILRYEQLALKDLGHRVQGNLCEIRGSFSEHAGVDERIIHDRVRTVLGRYSSHPHAIKVQVTQGRVMLSGDILEGESQALIIAVKSVRGVSSVVDYLSRHEYPAEVPSLKGGGRRAAHTGIGREYWPPAYRVAFGLSSLMVAVQGMRRGGGFGWVAAVFGGLFLTRASLNMSFAKLLGIGVGPNVVAIQKTVTVKAPLPAVYELWRTPEKFPSFMRHVRAVDKLSERRHRWVISGPLGIAVPFVSELTLQQENRRIGWQSAPGALIAHRGSVYFEDHGDATTIHLHMHYNPCVGMLGHLAAFLLHTDPKTKLDAELARMKCMLETGKQLHGASRPIAAQRSA